MDTETVKTQYSFPKKLRKIALALIAISFFTVILQIVSPIDVGGSEHEGAAKDASVLPVVGQENKDSQETHYLNPRLFYAIHLALLCALPMALGGLFFCAINHLAGSRWNISIRRVAEHSIWFLPIPFLLLLIVFYGIGDVFHHWVHAPETDLLIAGKKAYLNIPFFIIRNVVIFILWGIFGYMLWYHSIRQDSNGSLKHTVSMSRHAAFFLIVFCVGYSVSSWDLSMSLEPHWYSTMWAVYIFAGLALTTYALLILWASHFRKNNLLIKEFNENHLHDLGKFCFGHTVFWGYIAISQYLLIWYAAIPEETIFFKARWEHGWAWVSFGLAIVRFVLPFFLLLKREVKRNFRYMQKIAILILIGQVWDMYWILYPTLKIGTFVAFSWPEIGTIAFVAGSYLYIMGTVLQKYPLIPVKDARLQHCLNFHQ